MDPLFSDCLNVNSTASSFTDEAPVTAQNEEAIPLLP